MTASSATDQASPAQMGAATTAEIRAAPRHLRLAWSLLVALVVVEGAHEAFGLPGPDALYAGWIHGSVIVAAAALCLARPAQVQSERGAWLALGAGMVCWGAGTVLWNLLYDGNPDPPYPTPADVLWLLWYPFTALGIALLIRTRVSHFELHRWMDGLAVMLLVLAAAFPITLQPVDQYLHRSPLAAIVDISYPILDTLLLGAILGTFGLLAWRPGKVWLLLGFGCLIMAIADATFAAQQARGIGSDTHYDFIWAGGAVLIAYAAWATPGPYARRELTGLQAIALPLAAQLLAVVLQACIVLFPAFDTETHRIVVLVVLIIATIQIVLARPRIKRR